MLDSSSLRNLDGRIPKNFSEESVSPVVVSSFVSGMFVVLALGGGECVDEDVFGDVVMGEKEMRGGVVDELGISESLVVLELSDSPYSVGSCLLYTSPSPRDRTRSRMPSSA